MTVMTSKDSGMTKQKLLFVSNLFPDIQEPYRGLDNATVLHHLRDQFDIRVVSPRASLRFMGRARTHEPRSGDTPFNPVYVPCGYLPKIGGLANHHLMSRALRPVLVKLQEDWAWDVTLSSWLFPDGCASTAITSEFQRPSFLLAQGSDVHQYLKSPLRRSAILGACKQTCGTITRSLSLAMMLQQAGVPSEKLHPVHNGTDTDLFCPADSQSAKVDLGLSESSTVLLFVGNLLPVKAPLSLIRCFSSLIRQFPEHDLQLVLVGKGPLRNSIETEAAKLGIRDRILMTGPQSASQVAQWMQASDILVMTSLNEGLPNVILEAQAVGLPIVTTDVGDVAEMIPSDDFGRLAPVGNAKAWIQAVAEVIQAPPVREKIAATGQQRTWRATADAYSRLLRQES